MSRKTNPSIDTDTVSTDSETVPVAPVSAAHKTRKTSGPRNPRSVILVYSIVDAHGNHIPGARLSPKSTVVLPTNVREYSRVSLSFTEGYQVFDLTIPVARVNKE